MKLGIIGAENSHARQIATVLNIRKCVPGFRVTHIWGEKPEFAQATAETCQIPHIVRRPREMLGAVDCVMVDHRDGKHHVKAALPFIDAGLPCFIDKPLSTSLEEAKAVLARRKETGAPVTTFSSLPLHSSIPSLKKELKKLGNLKAIHLHGEAEYKSPYSGIYFYGIHTVALMVELLGRDVQSVEMTTNGDACTTVCHYPGELTATVTLVPDLSNWCVSAVGSQGIFQHEMAREADPYLKTARIVTKMFRTRKEPFGDEWMLGPLAVLEAMKKSLARRKLVAVPSIG
ncbi:MAG: Gfo/Idh/MocA family oxidoreductase [Planctomycetota bacterium]